MYPCHIWLYAAAFSSLLLQRVVDTSTRRKLSIISLNLLLPATTFYHIARTVSNSTIAQYLPFAANTVLRHASACMPAWPACL